MQLAFEEAESALGAGLPEPLRTTLSVIVLDQPAWLPLRSVGTSRAEAVSELVALGLVVLWELDALGHPFAGGPRVTLTPWGAEALHVELSEDVDEFPKWVQAESPDFPTTRGGIRMPRATGAYGMPLPELVEDGRQKRDPEYVEDVWTGEPLELFRNWTGRGVPVEIDRRAKAPGSKNRKRQGQKQAV